MRLRNNDRAIIVDADDVTRADRHAADDNRPINGSERLIDRA